MNIKKFSFCFISLVFLTCFVYCNTGYSYTKPVKFTPIQFSFFPTLPNWPKAKNVTGIKLGLPFASSTDESTYYNVYGIEVGLFSASNSINGLQTAFGILGARNIKGCQVAWVNIKGNNTQGLQVSSFNHSLQDFTGCQFAAGNFIVKNGAALQIGALNYLGDNSKGFQIGIVNKTDKFSGSQWGLINLNNNKNSFTFQIGLINYIENGFLPIFPLFNFSIRKKEIEIITQQKIEE